MPGSASCAGGSRELTPHGLSQTRAVVVKSGDGEAGEIA